MDTLLRKSMLSARSVTTRSRPACLAANKASSAARRISRSSKSCSCATATPADTSAIRAADHHARCAALLPAPGSAALGRRVSSKDEFRQNQHKLIPAITAGNVAHPQVLTQDSTQSCQECITGGMSVSVIDALEVVDVEHRDTQGCIPAPGRDAAHVSGYLPGNAGCTVLSSGSWIACSLNFSRSCMLDNASLIPSPIATASCWSTKCLLSVLRPGDTRPPVFRLEPSEARTNSRFLVGGQNDGITSQPEYR